MDEKLWAKFKEAILRKHGTLRKLSSEVESPLRTSLIDEKVGRDFEKMDARRKFYNHADYYCLLGELEVED